MRVWDTCARALLAVALAGCTSGAGDAPDADAGGGGPHGDAAASSDGAPDTLGTSEDDPAASCGELRAVRGPESGVYWVRRPDGVGDPFQVYCEQELNQGGWAMVYNSVLTAGQTMAFWQFVYAARFSEMGTADPAANYYRGSLYLFGVDYMDVIEDLDGKLVVAAVVATGGIDETTMAFVSPTLTTGNTSIFTQHFGSGWSSGDHDGDTYAPENCAARYSSVAQHYGSCWSYNLGSDADDPVDDGGVGPHVNNAVLTTLGLSVEVVGSYSRVKRIARFTRW